MNSTVADAPLTSYSWQRESTEETTTLPLDDFLTVHVAHLPDLRGAIRDFLREHCAKPRGLSFVAARGKLVAEFVPVASQELSFGEVLKQARAAVSRSEFADIRKIDARDLASAVCASV